MFQVMVSRWARFEKARKVIEVAFWVTLAILMLVVLLAMAAVFVPLAILVWLR